MDEDEEVSLQEEEADKENDDTNGLPSMPAVEQQQQPQQFEHGSIKKIVLENFLTYDNVVCKPGPYLNVVVGPNGTGKSSIICGICLAVGGSPKLLGRSDNFSDFVKHGKQQASVKLHIWDSERKREVVFAVLINVHKNSAIYLIDGNKKKMSEIRDEATFSYNIQVDNPCTFLAQDKVKSFTEQGPLKLLRNTEKAGPPRLLELHKDIEEQAAEGSDYDERLERMRQRLANLEVDLRTKKDRADNYMEWANSNEYLNLLKIKQANIEYERQLDRLRTATGQLDAKKKALDQANGQIGKTDKSMSDIKVTIGQLEKELEQLKRTKNAEFLNVRQLLNTSQMDEDLQHAADRFQHARVSFENWDKERENIQQEHQRFKTLYERRKLIFVPDKDLQRAQEQMHRENERVKAEEAAIVERQKALFNLDSQLHTRENNQKALLDNKVNNLVRLRNNPDIMLAWQYYTRNREQFKGPVYIPYLHMTIPGRDNLVFFENAVSSRDLALFIFSCREDEELLLHQFKIDTSIIDQPFMDENRFQRNELPTELRALGFTDYLSSLFNAPEPVSAYLRGVFNLDKILVGGPTVDDNYEQACTRARDINRFHQVFLTHKLRIEVSGSRFDKSQVYVDRRFLNRNLKVFGEEHTKGDIEVDFAGELRQLEENRRILGQREAKVSAEKEALKERNLQLRARQQKQQKEEDQLEQLRQQTLKYEGRLHDFSMDKPDLDRAKREYEATKRQSVAQNLDNLDRLAELLESQRDLLVNYALKNDELVRLRMRLKNQINEKEDQEGTKNELADSYKAVMRQREQVKKDVDNSKQFFSAIAKYSPANDDQSEEERAKFQKVKQEWEKRNIPEDVDELDELLAKEQRKFAKGRKEGNQEDVEEYDKLVRERQQISHNIETIGEKNTRWKQKMDDKLAKWLKGIRKLVANISLNYSNFFSKLGCAAEVQLIEPGNKYKIEAYGIDILIKFRNGTVLRRLDPHTQSGGERSVATMLYIMALQNLCPVPFRCVDEINQGMDPQNERGVFNMMVNLLNTDSQKQTQYFLLTPKLLNGLEFNERVTVHIVHNGPAIENPLRWDVNRFLNAN